MTDKNDAQKIIEEMKQTNADARKFLAEIDKKIALLDLKYAQILVKDDINTLKSAKRIVGNKEKRR